MNMDRDMIGHLGSFLDTASMENLSSLDPTTAAILKNQLEVATKSDQLSNQLLHLKGSSTFSPMQSLRKYLFNPETKQQALIGRTAMFKFATEVADAYRRGQTIAIPARQDIMVSTSLVRYIQEEFPQLFGDFIKGLMGPEAIGIKDVMFFMGDDVADLKWLSSLSDVGRSRVLDQWFTGNGGRGADNELLTIQLIRNLPSQGYILDKPFEVATQLFSTSQVIVSDDVRNEFANFLGKVHPSKYSIASLEIHALLAAESFGPQFESVPSRGDDALLSAMIKYLWRKGEVDEFDDIYNVVSDINDINDTSDDSQLFVETRAVLDDYLDNGEESLV